jgi:anti-sigma regulatory factor (Ser/Thr protein kinase)
LSLATHEAAANAIQHARPSGVVTIEATIDDRNLTIDIADGGAWDGRANNDGDDEHSRGLGVIYRLIDIVDIRTGPRGTTIRLQQSISA